MTDTTVWQYAKHMVVAMLAATMAIVIWLLLDWAFDDPTFYFTADWISAWFFGVSVGWLVRCWQ